MSIRIAALTAALFVAGPFASAARAETPQEKATRLLDSNNRAKIILQFLHLGSNYSGHTLTGSGGVNVNGLPKPGHFYLEYRYDWKVGNGDLDSTTLSFFFDANGNLSGIKIDNTTAVLNQPFALANLSIQVLGAAIKNSNGFRDLSDAQQRAIGKLIDDANAKGLLELVLAIDLATSR